MPIKAECGSCHKRFKAPDKLAGKKIKCPQCGGAIPIPVPAPPQQAQGDTYGIAEEPNAEAVAPPPPQVAASACPSCGSPLVEKAVLCVLCGYDLRSGQKLETQQAAPSDESQVTLKRADWKAEEEKQEKRKKRKRRRSRSEDIPQGILFLRGLAVSFGAALIGSFMWLGVCYSFYDEVDIAAWVLGGMAGVGMRIGYGVEDVLAGLASAGVALVAVYVAHVMIVAAVLTNPAHFTDDASFDEATQAEMEAAMQEAIAEMEAAMAEMPGEGASEEGMAPGGEMAEQELTEEQRAAIEAMEQALAEGAADMPALRMSAGFILITSVVGGFFSMFWPPWNILYLILACATAYVVGSGGDWFGE
jgi:hypothetical protein